MTEAKNFEDFKDLVISLSYSRGHTETFSSIDQSEPDPGWEYVDAQGHNHWRSKKKDNPYPTLIEVEDPDSGGFDEGGEEYGRTTHYECAVCGEVIEPGRTTSYYARIVSPGPMTGKLKYPTKYLGKPAIGTAYLTPKQIEDLNFHMHNHYDYGHKKAREILLEAIKNQTVEVRQIIPGEKDGTF